MYKLVIADDEKIIQEGLAKLIKWEELGFEIVGIFDDGADVIEYLNNMPVDVILTDIMMNYMTGIDVARFVKEEQISSKVVFISAHKEFELAFQGIKYGVNDYVLKPTKPAELKAVFLKIKEELDKRTQDLEWQKVVEERWKEFYPSLQEKFIGNLIMGALDKKLLEQQWRLLYPQIDPNQCPCVLADLKIEDYETFINSEWHYGLGQFDDALSNFMRVYEAIGAFHIVYKNKDRMKLFGVMKKSEESSVEIARLCNSQLKLFVSQLSDVFKFHIRIEREKVFSSIFQIIDKREDIIGMDVHGNHVEIYFYEQKKMIMTNLMMGNVKMAQKMVQGIIKSMSEEDFRYRRHLLVDIFSSISEFLWENNRQLYTIVQPFIVCNNMANMTSWKEMEAYCDYVFESMKTKEVISDYFDQGSLVNQIKKYVQEHIYEDVSLESVANEVFLSAPYLSSLFKKQTGENFLQFVTRKKMEKAVELLRESQYKVYQVGEALGYKTTRHFSRLFYSFMGYYPNQYRKEVLGIGESSDEE
uniref:response regulator transcription factor n=1 Tax=Agathobacter sp. TaxID=2021311 RepID=UPI0040567170